MREIVLKLIFIFQKVINPFFKNMVFLRSYCRFSPSCSEYLYQSVEKHGIIKGCILGFKRVINCHPVNLFV